MHRHTALDVRLTRRRLLSLAAGAAAVAVTACTGEDTDPEPGPTAAASSDGVQRPDGWRDATHGNQAPPDYDTVFARDRVHQLALTVSPQDWRRMLDDMTVLYGPRGGPPGRGGRAGEEPADNPIWVPARVDFNGGLWTNAGLRFKGSSSLRRGWLDGVDKLPFKLDFDQFEDAFPAVHNQRFHGFKQLSLANNTADPTMMRETISYDLLRDAGLVAAETAFYALSLDRGNGPAVDLGLYTMVEVIEDTVIGRAFPDASGNLYEAKGAGAGLAATTRDQIPAGFQVESDEDRADWSDLYALSDVLHSPLRAEDPAAWRSRLEALFDVETFLTWLAAAALLQHWDAYGAMPHNYYLYNNPENGRLTWISWDHNLVLPEAGRQGQRERVDFDRRDAGDDWPLFSVLLSQPAYFDLYNHHLRRLLEGPFEPARIGQRVDTYATLLAPIAAQEVPAYTTAVNALKHAIDQRTALARAYLAAL